MEPTTLMLAATAFNVIGKISAGNASSSAANYNAQIAQQNAQIARDQGTAAAEQHDKAARKQIGKMVADYGAAGVDPAQGSPMDMLQDSVRTAKLDNLTTRYNYDLRARSFMNEANLNSMQASTASTSGVLGAAGAAATGYGKYNQLKYPGTKIPGVTDDSFIS